MEVFLASYLSFWANALNFSGRTRRRDYWTAVVINSVLTSILSSIWGVIFGTESTMYTLLTGLVSLAICIPAIANSVRRLHDSGKSGYWWLLSLTFVGAIVPFVFCFFDSEQGTNKYGENPKVQQNS